MGSCCSTKTETTPSSDQRVLCPSCNTRAKEVGFITLLHQVKAPMNQRLPEQTYFFCTKLDCNLVYFAPEGLQFDRQQVREAVGLKSTDPHRTLCYCFDISDATVSEEIRQTGTSASKAFVVEQTKLKNCACDIRNPSGRCCLKEFPND